VQSFFQTKNGYFFVEIAASEKTIIWSYPGSEYISADIFDAVCFTLLLDTFDIVEILTGSFNHDEFP
jgi:hypothetical protein